MFESGAACPDCDAKLHGFHYDYCHECGWKPTRPIETQPSGYSKPSLVFRRCPHVEDPSELCPACADAIRASQAEFWSHVENIAKRNARLREETEAEAQRRRESRPPMVFQPTCAGCAEITEERVYEDGRLWHWVCWKRADHHPGRVT